MVTPAGRCTVTPTRRARPLRRLTLRCRSRTAVAAIFSAGRLGICLAGGEAFARLAVAVTRLVLTPEAALSG